MRLSAEATPPGSAPPSPGEAVAELERRAEEANRSAAWVRAILDSTTDAICVTNEEQFVTDYNERFLELWGFAPEMIARRERGQIRAIVSRRLANPEEFFRRVREIRENQVSETRDVIELSDRKFVERTSRLLVLEGRTMGRVWRFRDITEQRRADEALQRNEAELRALADSMAQLAWMAEPDGNIFWYNRRWFEYTGGTLEEMRGWGWQSVHEPEMLPAVTARWSEAVRSGEPFEMEFKIRGADGVFRWFLTRAIPVRDAENRVGRWFGTCTDVDRTKRAEAALREETRVLELLNQTGTAIASRLELPELLRTVTNAGTELSGARVGAFFYAARGRGDQSGAFVLSACSGDPPEHIEEACEGRDEFLSRVFLGGVAVRRDDSPDDVASTGFPPSRSYMAVPVVSRSGELLGGLFFGHPDPGVFDARSERVLLGVAAQAAIAIDNARLYESAQREIAERAATEQRLSESEARLRVSLQTSELGTWELDLKTGFVTLDERAQELFQPVGAATISLEEFLAAAHPEDQPARSESMRRVCTGELDRYEMEFRIGDTGRWLRSGAKPVRDGGGEVVRVVGGVLDITAMMQARATIEDRQRELERLVEERTSSLHQAIAQMEEFSYSVSHDLRAPLRAIQGYAQAVIEDYADRVDQRGKDLLLRILHAGERMDRLTRDVLTYSRIARGVAPLSSLSLDRLVFDVIDQYSPVRRGRGFICVEQPLARVRGHEPLLVQAVSNLLANALKFVAEGETPRVRVWTEKRGGEVRLWIEDNGIGVRREHQARIWGMFERIHPPSKFEGTGIGLAIVRKAVERMGGGVGVVSDGKNGSRFWIQLQAA
jgi:PAS domain S-box-containing protein